VLLFLLCAAGASGPACARPHGERSGGAQIDMGGSPATPLKLGLLLDFSGPLAEYGPELRRGFELAIRQINAAGGVWGMPVEMAVGDTALDPTTALEEARRLIEIERVEGGHRARLADERGYDNVGRLYRDGAVGQGMAAAFEEFWAGTLKAVSINPGATSFTAELERSLEFAPQALILIAFPPETILILREALELGYYERFVFGAPARSEAISAAIGAARLAGMPGTYVAPAPANAASEAWLRAFLGEYGSAPLLPYVKETYDAAIALALAAEAAGASDGGAIRDRLRGIGSAPGLVVIPRVDSLAAGLAALREGTDIDYQGAAGTPDWHAQGDSTRGYIGVWAFAEDGAIVDLEVFAYSAE